jgi:hypothetical protein
MYRPREVFANGAYWNNEEDEFVELRNITGSPVTLSDPARLTNTWKLDRAVEFQFPQATTIPANGYLLVVNFNPATDPVQLGAFKTKYGIGGGVQILGPYKGNLANSDEAVALFLPDSPETSGSNAGQIPSSISVHSGSCGLPPSRTSPRCPASATGPPRRSRRRSRHRHDPSP